MLKLLATAALIAVSLAACKSAARAQDTFVPVGLKSSCEFIYDRPCRLRSTPSRPRVRVVRVPYRVYTPETLPPACARMEPLR